MQRSKRYVENSKKVDTNKAYALAEAISLLKETSNSKFDETVELAFNLGVDPKHSDQLVRGTVVLPNGTGKTRSILVVSEDPAKQKEAKDAGADFVGHTDMIDKIQDGWFDFDVLVATPGAMRDLSKLGRVLGPKGLMPTPKAGTVTDAIASSVDEIKKGKVVFKVDKTANVHVIVGKVSFAEEKIQENIAKVANAVVKARPASAKGVYIKSCTLSSTMGVGIGIDTKESVFSNG